MADKHDPTLSRRRVLGALGTVGAAGALGGAATTSLLWDEETFGNADNPNVLQAGALDLKVDWEEHYADWIDDDAGLEHDVLMTDPEDPDYVPFPTAHAPMVWVHMDDVEQFMENTLEESSDDFDGPDDVEREDAPDLVDQPPPVISLEDVKPGDFGEATFSYHLFDNPGFVALCADELSDTDNGIDEPEDKVNGHTPDDSDGDPFGEAGDGELGELVQATLWFDPNCNNRRDGEVEEDQVMVVFDLSDSMNDEFTGASDDIFGGEDGDTVGDRLEGTKEAMVRFLDQLQMKCGATTSVGALKAGSAWDPDGHVLDVSLTDDFGDQGDPVEDLLGFDGNNDISDDYQLDDGNRLDEGISGALDALPDSPGDNVQQWVVLVTDGIPAGQNERTDIQNAVSQLDAEGVNFVDVRLNDSGGRDGFWTALSFDGANRRAGSMADLEPLVDDLATTICQTQTDIDTETVIAQGTLNEVITAVDGCLLLDPAKTGAGVAPEFDAPLCHAPSDGCLALAWWLPRDIPGLNDNIVQTDRYEFRFGFNAVQCRHNIQDGEPINPPPIDDT